MKAFPTQEVPLADRLFGWWYRIAAPPEVPDEAPLRLRMRRRSGRLMSVVFLNEIIIITSFVIGCFITHDYVTAVAGSIPVITIVIGITLNRKGRSVTAGVLLLVIEEIAIVGSILVGNKTVSMHLLAELSFFLAPELIAAELITPWVTFPVTLGNWFIMGAMITFLPKTPEAASMLHDYFYVIYGAPMLTQMMVASVCFLWVSSTFKEMRRANSAEEVNKLTIEIAKRQQAVEQEKQGMEESIQQIISVHMQVANGNLSARVPLDRQNVLWAVAGSLNNLLARLQRWRYDAIRLQKNEEVIQQLLYQIQMARRHGKPLQVFTTGTSLDTLIFEIAKVMAALQPPAHKESISFEQPSTSHFLLRTPKRPDEVS